MFGIKSFLPVFTIALPTLTSIVPHLPLHRTPGIPFLNNAPHKAETTDWNQISLQMNSENQGPMEITLLRHKDWVEERSWKVGSKINLALNEIRTNGQATITAIQDNYPVSAGPGNLITGTFKSRSNNIHRITLEDSDAVLEVTGNHPLYSLTRKGWVHADKILSGEILKTKEGLIKVLSNQALSLTAPVFNLEIGGTKNYHVSSAEILAHNNDTCNPMDSNSGFRSRLSRPSTPEGFYRDRYLELKAESDALLDVIVELSNRPHLNDFAQLELNAARALLMENNSKLGALMRDQNSEWLDIRHAGSGFPFAPVQDISVTNRFGITDPSWGSNQRYHGWLWTDDDWKK